MAKEQLNRQNNPARSAPLVLTVGNQTKTIEVEVMTKRTTSRLMRNTLNRLYAELEKENPKISREDVERIEKRFKEQETHLV